MAQKPLVNAQVGKEIAAGLWFGLNPQDPPLWFDGENVVFHRGGPEKVLGPKLVVDLPPGEVITQIQQSFVGTERRAYLGTSSKLYRFSGFELTEIGTNYRGGSWSMVPWGSWLLATNGLDPVQVWKNTGVAETLSGPTFQWARLLAKRGQYVLAMNTDLGPTTVSWCDTDDVEDWTVTDTNAAGEYNIRDLDSEIRAWVPMGDSIAIYSQNSLVIGSYLGPPFYFGFKPALQGMGAVSRNSIVAVGRKNYGITRQGVFRTDGLEVQPIDDPAVRKWLQANVNWTAAEQINGYHADAYSTVVFNVPTGDASRPTVAVGYCYANQSWTKWALAADASSDRSVYEWPLVGSGSKLQHAVAGVGDHAAWIQSKPLDCGAPDFWKFFESLLWGIEVDGNGLSVQLGFSENPRDPIEWWPAQALTDKIDILREGVYLTVRVSTEAGDPTAWLLSSFQLYGQKAGKRML